MTRFFRLMLRNSGRFLAQWISVSTEPSAFVRDRIRLGDTNNFIAAGSFFFIAIVASFLAEVATLYLLGIDDLTAPYFWLAILLTSIIFVVLCFFLLRPVARLSLKDVLHLSLYPIGAAIFAGAALLLVGSAIVALLAEAGYIPEIRYDLTQWGDQRQLIAVKQRILTDCLKQDSFAVSLLAAEFKEVYVNLRPPIDKLSFLQPVTTVFYLVITARFFMAALKKRSAIVFSLVVLATVAATGANVLAAAGFFGWKLRHSGCLILANQASVYGVGESTLKEFVQDLEDASSLKDHPVFDISVRAEGRTLSFVYRLKAEIDNSEFHHLINRHKKDSYGRRCSKSFAAVVRATERHTFYDTEGERLTSYSVDRSDCPPWYELRGN